jgi:hypothetical protein
LAQLEENPRPSSIEHRRFTVDHIAETVRRRKTVTLASPSGLGKFKLFMTPIKKGYEAQSRPCAAGAPQLADFKKLPAKS